MLPFVRLRQVIVCTLFLVTSCSPATTQELFPALKSQYSVQVLGDRWLLSCQGRCGAAYGLPCSCDAKCLLYHNCCEDFGSACPHYLSESMKTLHDHWNAKVECSSSEYFVVAQCPWPSMTTASSTLAPAPGAVTTRLDDSDASGMTAMEGGELDAGQTNSSPDRDPEVLKRLIMNIPYTDPSSGIAYKNKKIFDCHRKNLGIEGVPWRLEIPALDGNRFENLAKISEMVIGPYARFVPPGEFENVSTVCIQETIGFCQNTLTTEEDLADLFGLCLLKDSSVVLVHEPHVSDKLFKNVYCAVCNVGRNLTLSPQSASTQGSRTWLFPLLVSLSAGEIRFEMMSETFKWQKSSCNIGKSQLLRAEDTNSRDILCGNFQCGKELYYRGDSCKQRVHVMIGVDKTGKASSTLGRHRLANIWKCYLRDVQLLEVEHSVTSDIFFDQQVERGIYTSRHRVYVSETQLLDLIAKRHFRSLMDFAKATKILTERQHMLKIKSLQKGFSDSTAVANSSEFPLDEDILRGELPENLNSVVCFSMNFDVKLLQSELSCFKEPVFGGKWGEVQTFLNGTCMNYLLAGDLAVTSRSFFWLLLGLSALVVSLNGLLW